MPIPFILGAIAVAAGATGVAKGVSGIKKINNAKEIMEDLEYKHTANQARLEKQEKRTQKAMDKLCKKQKEVVDSFKVFSDCFAKIQNRPDFKNKNIKSSEIASLNIKNLNKITTVSLSNIITKVGSITLGTPVITGSALGIGLMVGGFVVNRAGNKAQANVEEAREEYNKAKALIKEARAILREIEDVAKNYINVLRGINEEYFILLDWLKELVSREVNWDKFNYEEKQKLERIVILVQVLFSMCKVQFLVKQGKKQVLNKKKIDSALGLAEKFV